MAAQPKPAPVVEVRRSRKRRRTVAAYREDDKVVVLLPARFTRAEEKEWVATMLARLERSERRRRPSDVGLERRAAELGERYLDGRAVPDTVRWVANQRSRWGSWFFFLNFRCDSMLSGLTPSTTAPISPNRGKASRKSDASLVQPEVLSLG